jgi:cytochrome b involved in lipid metabolism
MTTKTRIVILAVFSILCAGLLFIIFRNTISQDRAVPTTTTTSTIATGTASNTTTTSSLTPTSTTALVTPTELAQHASSADCWMAIDGTVYNVTQFISKHPGGKAILKGCGKDATQMFNSVPAHAGSEAAQDLKGLPIIGAWNPS